MPAASAEEMEAVTGEDAESAADVASELSSLDALSSMGLDDEAADSSLVLPSGETGHRPGLHHARQCTKGVQRLP